MKTPHTLAAILDLLGVEYSGQLAGLAGMWRAGKKRNQGAPRLRRRSAATFLQLTFDPDVEKSIANSRLVSVWLDGRKID